MVSLLNHDPRFKLPPHRPSQQSRGSSYSNPPSLGHSDSSNTQTNSRDSPVHSPITPLSSSMDGASSQDIMEIHSPMTPTYPFEPLEQGRTVDPYSGRYSTCTYPNPLSNKSAELPYYQLSNETDRLKEDDRDEMELASLHDNLSPARESMGPVEGQAIAKLVLKKNKYPCPHAQRFKCADTFTTSGHAARHGKKHTGEKNIQCPDCSKAFTRKDNMKQHQRTHQRAHPSKVSSKTVAEKEEQRRYRAKPEHQAYAKGQSSQLPHGDNVAVDTVLVDEYDPATRARSERHSQLRIVTDSPSHHRRTESLESASDRLDTLASAATSLAFSPDGSSRYQGEDCMAY